MKAAKFDYERPATLQEAARLLADGERSPRVLAGGQSLGPMLNLRLATPELLIDVRRIPEMNRAEESGDAVTLGACTTHAAIEDGKTRDATGGIMSRVARGIAYRAVRNRGTIGGSLAHADPAADWITCLCALDAELQVYGGGGTRKVPIRGFVVGPFETALSADEIIEAVRIPKVSRSARWGFHKVARKAGKFADAMAAVLWDPERNVARAAMGAMEGRPVVIDDASTLLKDARLVEARRGDDPPALEMLNRAGLTGDVYAQQVHVVALRRALAQVRSQ